MQKVTNIKEIENAISVNGEMIIAKNSDSVVIMSIEEYKEKLCEEKIERKLLKAEKQIEEGETIKATEVFRELEEKYGF